MIHPTFMLSIHTGDILFWLWRVEILVTFGSHSYYGYAYILFLCPYIILEIIPVSR